MKIYRFPKLTFASQKADKIKSTGLKSTSQEALVTIQPQAKNVELPKLNNGKNMDADVTRSDWGNFPDTVIVHDSGTIADHIDYKAAKAGDLDAAIRVVDDYLTENKLHTIKDLIDKHP